jgi:hypothetical protein
MPTPADSHPGSVVLDLGADVGALVVRTTEDLVEHELQIEGIDPRGLQYRTHTVVRRREVGGSAVFAAVFPSVPAGHHAVWGDTTARIEVDVVGGAVTEAVLPRPR